MSSRHLVCGCREKDSPRSGGFLRKFCLPNELTGALCDLIDNAAIELLSRKNFAA